jgi:DNA-binding Lrp family transcriptional regulator
VSYISPKGATRFRVLRILEKNPAATQRELAAKLGLSLSKTNYLVNALLEKRVIKVANFRRLDTKLRKIAYLLTPEGIS